MILCVNLNAAIDKTIVVNGFKIGEIHRPQKVLALAGGKGCNVARALKQFGQSPLVTGWIGGTAGQFIEANLHQEGIATDFVYTDAESRTCTSILDANTQTLTEIYEAGEAILPDKVEAMLDRFRELVERVTAVSLSGSLPPGVPPNFYAQLSQIAQAANTPVFLDSSGEALRHGAAARPFLIKPNEKEIAILAERKLSHFSNFAAAAADVSLSHDTIVVLSLGANGALAAKEGQVMHLKAPPVQAISPVGSGDCMLAGLMFGFAQGLDWVESARIGVAAGTANTLKTGAGKFSVTDFNEILAKVSRELVRG